MAAQKRRGRILVCPQGKVALSLLEPTRILLVPASVR